MGARKDAFTDEFRARLAYGMQKGKSRGTNDKKKRKKHGESSCHGSSVIAHATQSAGTTAYSPGSNVMQTARGNSARHGTPQDKSLKNAGKSGVKNMIVRGARESRPNTRARPGPPQGARKPGKRTAFREWKKKTFRPERKASQPTLIPLSLPTQSRGANGIKTLIIHMHSGLVVKC